MKLVRLVEEAVWNRRFIMVNHTFAMNAKGTP